MKKLDLDPIERDLLEDLRALTSDTDGREILIGLTYDETLEYQALAEAEVADRLANRPTSAAAEARWQHLLDRHSQTRMAVSVAELELRRDKPALS